MVHIDYDSFKSGIPEIEDDMFKQRFSPYPHQCLRHAVGYGFKPGAESSGEYHCLHHFAKVVQMCGISKQKRVFILSSHQPFLSFGSFHLFYGVTKGGA